MLNIYSRRLWSPRSATWAQIPEFDWAGCQIGRPDKSPPLWQTPVPSAHKRSVTRRHGNLRRYFVLHYFYLPCVNCGARPAGPADVSAYRRPAIFGGLPARSAWPALNKSGSGLCEAAPSTIVVEGPIRHLQQRLRPAQRLSGVRLEKIKSVINIPSSFFF